ncbi:AfsR/SARP family transcriptional regulator [Streptomyces sp. NPDC090106]|uniref:AfsR/SARP family transcriptional regulator n=1 Tax=Streptomyces sp. NPDC090106 TaxID=3365946 RepID=UPI0037FA44D2
MTGFRLLGPVELWVSGRSVDLGPAKQRTVLAALLADAGRWVTAETLIDRVWGEDPPARVRASLYAHVARIRRVVAEAWPALLVNAGAAGGSPTDGNSPSLLRGSGGYRLDVPAHLVDVHRFRQLVARARKSTADSGSETGALALEALREAMGLWHGEPLAGLSGDWVARTREAWQRQRLDAVTAWAEAELEVGGPLAVVDTLTVLVAEHPLVEPLTVTLMRALRAAGRAPEALTCYAALRQRLAEELGTRPGAEARQEHLALLGGRSTPPQPRPATNSAARPGRQVTVPAAKTPDSGAATDSTAGTLSLLDTAPPPRPRVVPAQLPMNIADFTGRMTELADLDNLLVSGGERPSAVVVSAVSGTAGVGKTALAVHWAHRVRDRFPDGQLYVNLRGYDPDQPLTAADALARFLSALGVPAQDVPVDTDDRAARYRTEVTDRRMLIVLDNAATVEQVRPLLPGTPSCAVLVTSRDRLAGLVAREGARRLHLELLPAEAAAALLRRLIGARAEAEPEAVDLLAAQCARLPLALRVAAELAASRPTDPLTDLVAELADQQRRLELLDADGDPRAAVASVFSWSLRQLPEGARHIFRLIGLHPGLDLDAHAAAALTDSTPADARRALDLLTRAHLAGPTGRARFGMHDLLRAYAARLAAAEDGPGACQAALDRLFDHYLATASAAMDRLHPAEAHLRPTVRESPTTLPDLPDPGTAREWLNTERTCLTAMSAFAVAHGRPRHAVLLSSVLYRYLSSSHHTDGLTIHGHARDAARTLGDLASEARALLGLGTAYWQLSRHEPARDHLQAALALFQKADDPVGQARALVNLSLVEERLGRFRSAVEYLEQALVLYRGVGDRSGEAMVLKNLASVEGQRGRYVQAAEHLRHALELLRRIGNQYLLAHSLNDLGTVETRLGLLDSAGSRQEQALDLFREIGDRYGEAGALLGLGTVLTRRGEHTRAAGLHREALAIYGQNGDRDGEARALVGLGEAVNSCGLPEEALTHYADALSIAEDTGIRGVQARAHSGLGDAHGALGASGSAVGHYERALTLFTELGMPDAENVRRKLASTREAERGTGVEADTSR